MNPHITNHKQDESQDICKTQTSDKKKKNLSRLNNNKVYKDMVREKSEKDKKVKTMKMLKNMTLSQAPTEQDQQHGKKKNVKTKSSMVTVQKLKYRKKRKTSNSLDNLSNTFNK